VLEKAGYRIAEEEGKIFVIISLDDSSSDSDSEMNDEGYLCEDILDMNVNKLHTVCADEEENWE